MAPAPLELEGVSAPIIQALVDRGVTALTPVQEACLPHCLAGKDVMAKVRVCTGKQPRAHLRAPAALSTYVLYAHLRL